MYLLLLMLVLMMLQFYLLLLIMLLLFSYVVAVIDISAVNQLFATYIDCSCSFVDVDIVFTDNFDTVVALVVATFTVVIAMAVNIYFFCCFNCCCCCY